MDIIAAQTGSYGTVIVPGRSRLKHSPCSPVLLETAEKYVADGWIDHDKRYLAVPALIRSGVATDFDFTTLEAMSRDPYYQEFLAPFGLRYAALVQAEADEELWAVSIQRSTSQGPFLQEELDRLSKLSKKLSSAVALSRALGFARAEAALDAFEASHSAVALLDLSGNVFRLNSAAEAMLGPDLFIRRRRLCSSNQDANAQFDRALHSALRSADHSALLAPIVLPRRGGRPYLAYISRPIGIARDVFAPCQAIVVLVDLEAGPGEIDGDLRKVYKLTPSEARLAVRILEGASLRTAADLLGITYETARWLLKGAMHKMDTHRQSEFVALLARFAQGRARKRESKGNGRSLDRSNRDGT